MASNDIPPWVTDSVPEEEKPVDQKIKARGYFPVLASPSARPGDQIYTLQGYHMRETEKAVLFEVHQINGAPWDPESGADNTRARQHWFPLSQVKSITHAPKAVEDGTLEYDNIQVKEWILKSKELI